VAGVDAKLCFGAARFFMGRRGRKRGATAVAPLSSLRLGSTFQERRAEIRRDRCCSFPRRPGEGLKAQAGLRELASG
jgi:hypothetical protein